MRSVLIIVALMISAGAPAVQAPAQSRADERRFEDAQKRMSAELAIFKSEFERYQKARARDLGYGRNHPDDRYEEGYDPARHYRDDPRYSERTLSAEERVYRGSDGRYYCKRSDGTTGLIIGAVGGGILGNVIDGGHSRTVGTLIGGALGALAGRAIEQRQSEIRCR